ncbi:MAG: hypothetical protein AAF570_18500, partial [Bacteroidota bacterium]
MQFAELFSFEVRHTYFADGRCPDFGMVPTPDTQRILDGHRLLMRPFSGGFRVYAELNDLGEFMLPLAQGTLFRFLLQLENPNFYNYTDLSPFRAHQQIYDNAAAILLPDGVLQISHPVHPPLPAEGEAPAPVELTEEEAEDLAYASRAWALLKLQVNQQFPTAPGTPLAYAIEWAAATQAWRYYLTTAQDGANLQLVDSAGALSFSKLDLTAIGGDGPGYAMVPQLDGPAAWTGSDLSGNGLDFEVTPSEIQSSGPAPSGDTIIYLSTGVTQMPKMSWHFDLNL